MASEPGGFLRGVREIGERLVGSAVGEFREDGVIGRGQGADGGEEIILCRRAAEAFIGGLVRVGQVREAEEALRGASRLIAD